ncbi:MAG: MotA/TolQ/ExbB proton channel family protein [Lachnospiraceae bacterium]|nr:MotA/TolQ/ExbB proton channel family protein [Lachnospiraceae bacterium]
MVFKIIFQNLIGFDLMIIIVGILNGVCYYFVRKFADQLYKKLHLQFFVPSHSNDHETIPQKFDAKEEEEIVSLRKKAEALYAVFVNVTAIFPLLGILGTVLSLIPLVSQMAAFETNFFAALTSTFWGLVFAIVFKLLDGFLSARMEDNEKSVELFLARFQDRIEAEKNGTETAPAKKKEGAKEKA